MFAKLSGFKNLIVWQKADDLALLVRELTAGFSYVDGRLVRDMRGSSGSVPFNIAEGYGRAALGDYIHFCEIARGSLGELGTQLHHCERAGLLTGEKLQRIARLYEQTCYFLDRLLQSLRKKQEEGQWDRKFWVKEGTAPYEIGEDEFEGNCLMGN